MTLYTEIGGEQTEWVLPTVSTPAGLFDLKIRTFLDAIKYNKPAPVPSSQILYNQAILDGIAKSSKLGKEIKITIPKI